MRLIAAGPRDNKGAAREGSALRLKKLVELLLLGFLLGLLLGGHRYLLLLRTDGWDSRQCASNEAGHN
jgi:hypothetical protein